MFRLFSILFLLVVHPLVADVDLSSIVASLAKIPHTLIALEEQIVSMDLSLRREIVFAALEAVGVDW